MFPVFIVFQLIGLLLKGTLELVTRLAVRSEVNRDPDVMSFSGVSTRSEWRKMSPSEKSLLARMAHRQKVVNEALRAQGRRTV